MSPPAGSHVPRHIDQKRDAEWMGRTQQETDFKWKTACHSQLNRKVTAARGRLNEKGRKVFSSACRAYLDTKGNFHIESGRFRCEGHVSVITLETRHSSRLFLWKQIVNIDSFKTQIYLTSAPSVRSSTSDGAPCTAECQEVQSLQHPSKQSTSHLFKHIRLVLT